MIRALCLLHLRRLPRRPLRSVVLVLSVAAGVSLVVTVGVVQTSLSRSLTEHGRSLAGPAPLRVVGPVSRGGLAASTLQPVEAVDGVEAAVPVVQAVTLAEDASGQETTIVALGVDCRVEALVGELGCTPQMITGADPDNPPILSANLARALGEDGVIRTDLGDRPVAGATVAGELDEVNEGRVAVYAMPVAQELFVRPDSYDAIYVLPESGVDLDDLRGRLGAAAGPQNIVLDATQPPPEVESFGLLLPLLGFLGLFAFGIGGVLVHNTLVLAVEERRRDLAVAGALGAGSGVLVGGTLLEAGLLGALGGALGAGAGILLAAPILDSFEVFMLRLAGASLEVHAGWVPFAVGGGLGLLLALAAAVRPALRAGRLDVVAELGGRRRDADPLRTPSLRTAAALGLLSLGALGVVIAASRRWPLEPWAPAVGSLAMLVVVLTAFWAVSRAAPRLFHTASRRLGDRGPVLRLGLANLTREGLRTSVMVVATAAAVGIALTISSFGSAMRTSLVEVRLAETGRGLWASTTPWSNAINLEAKIPPDVVRALGDVPGVARVDTSTVVGVHGLDGTEWGATTEPATLPYELLVGTADPDRLRDGEVIVGPTLARTQGVEPGDALTVPGREGLREITVQGVWANGDFNGSEIAMPRWLLEDLWGPQPPEAAIVRVAEGATPEEVSRRIHNAGLDPHLQVRTPAEQVELAAEDLGAFFDPFWAIQRALVGVAFAAVLFTLLLAAVQRRREHGLLAAVGLSPGGLGRLVLVEAAAVAVVGTLLGTAVGIVMLKAFVEAFFLSVPFRIPFAPDLGAPLVYGLVALGVLGAAAAWPAWRTSRLEVVEALHYE